MLKKRITLLKDRVFAPILKVEALTVLFNRYQENMEEFKNFLRKEGIIFQEESWCSLTWTVEDKKYTIYGVSSVLIVQKGNRKPEFISGKENIFNYLIG